MDAETAFLQGDLHEDVYMKQANGYDVQIFEPEYLNIQDKSGHITHYRLATEI